MGAAEKIDLSGILNDAREQFKDKTLKDQMVMGSELHVPTQPSDFVYWPNSPWHITTGVPGLPFGRIVQIAGRPDSGKSTHAMKFIKLAQDQGYLVILWDTEGKWSPHRFETHFKGDSEKLMTIQSRVILEGGDMVRALVRASRKKYPDKKILIVWDSVGGTISKSESQKDFRDSLQMAEAAKDIGKICRGIVSLMEEFRNNKTGEHNIAALFVNQTYANIGSHGDKESGGYKLEFFSSIICQLTRKADLFKVRDKIKRKVGVSSRFKIRKNHLMDTGDSVAEAVLDITAGGITINSKDPAVRLLGAENSLNDLIEDESSED